MFTKEEPMSLTNLGDGAAIEMFDEELQRVLDNIVDPNTEAKQVREITLKVKITPDEDRNLGSIEIIPATKLGSPKKFVTTCVIGRSGRRGEAREIGKNQQSFISREGKVTPIDKAREE